MWLGPELPGLMNGNSDIAGLRTAGSNHWFTGVPYKVLLEVFTEAPAGPVMPAALLRGLWLRWDVHSTPTRPLSERRTWRTCERRYPPLSGSVSWSLHRTPQRQNHAKGLDSSNKITLGFYSENKTLKRPYFFYLKEIHLLKELASKYF